MGNLCAKPQADVAKPVQQQPQVTAVKPVQPPQASSSGRQCTPPVVSRSRRASQNYDVDASQVSFTTLADNGSMTQQRAISDALASAEAELLASRSRRFADKYECVKAIGRGAFATVYVALNKKTGVKYAAKVSKKVKAPEPPPPGVPTQRDNVLREISIMRLMRGHPNMVDLVEVFEDDAEYYLVMELCTGGELFDRIIAKGCFSEADAARYMACIIDLLATAHSKWIMHRDIKPENIMLSHDAPDAPLKVIDWGTSEFVEPGKKLRMKFGTPYYVAPEVLSSCYDCSADVWSAGVILFVLLCGLPPFNGRTESRILAKVKVGAYNFDVSEWDVVSAEAKQLLRGVLVVDPAGRLSARQVLAHSWFEVARTATLTTLGDQMVSSLAAFAGMTRLKRLALTVLARQIDSREVKRLREAFIRLDDNHDGLIDSADLHRALEEVGAAIPADELDALFEMAVSDGSGEINYEQFIASMLDSNRVIKRPAALRRSFEILDKDGDGFITTEDLMNHLDSMYAEGGSGAAAAAAAQGGSGGGSSAAASRGTSSHGGRGRGGASSNGVAPAGAAAAAAPPAASGGGGLPRRNGSGASLTGGGGGSSSSGHVSRPRRNSQVMAQEMLQEVGVSGGDGKLSFNDFESIMTSTSDASSSLYSRSSRTSLSLSRDASMTQQRSSGRFVITAPARGGLRSASSASSVQTPTATPTATPPAGTTPVSSGKDNRALRAAAGFR